MIQELRKYVTILKPERGNGTVLFDIKDLTDSVEYLFKDPKKVPHSRYRAYNNANEIVTKLSRNTASKK